MIEHVKIKSIKKINYCKDSYHVDGKNIIVRYPKKFIKKGKHVEAQRQDSSRRKCYTALDDDEQNNYSNASFVIIFFNCLHFCCLLKLDIYYEKIHLQSQQFQLSLRRLP